MRLLPLAPALLLLAACTVEPVPQPVDPVPTCGAEGLQGLVGQPARVLDTMRFSQPPRVITPGMAVTMDYREDRLNIEVNRSRRIDRVYCG